MPKQNKQEQIIEAVFLHGKNTPDKSCNLPDGQMTIIDAINQLNALISQTRQEAVEEILAIIDEAKKNAFPYDNDEEIKSLQDKIKSLLSKDNK